MTYDGTPNKIPLNFKRWWVMWFWDENFKYNEQTGCLEWIKSLNRRGYGRTSMNNQIYFAHRIAYAIHYGVDPGDKLVMHLCDNPRCCNPLHLELGTHDDNSKDMVKRGRNQTGDQHWSKRMPERLEEMRKTYRANGRRLAAEINGANHPTTVLTDELVREIKQRSATGESNRDLAKAFGVTHSNISAIILGKSWGHIEGAVREKNGKWQPKLTPEKVREIRIRYVNGHTIASLARDYELTSASIHKVVNHISWKHIE